jgi:polyisoprenoid-binding protein YceI
MSTTSAPTASLPQIGVWAIDSHHSTIHFSVTHHAVATFRSTFTNVSGAYNAEQGELDGHVPVKDITLTGLDRLKGHIFTPDFFNAEEFPTIAFHSTKVHQDRHEVVVEGELTLRGVTKPIIARGSVTGPQAVHHGDGHVSERLGIDLTTTIDRREWGVSFNNEVAQGVTNLGWDVRIDAALELFQDVQG